MPDRLPKQHYPHAPITEALIDLRVELPPELAVAALGQMLEGDEAMKNAYPGKEALLREEFQFAPGIGASSMRQEAGFRYRSADGKYVCQARVDGFTMSRLAPYENWETFQPEAQRLWTMYRAIANPAKVTRVAVRYINRIEVPLPVKDFSEYFRTFPEVSSDLPQGLAGFFMQLRMDLNEAKSFAIVNQTILEDVKPGRDDIAPFLLDIDIFRTVELPTEDDEIWRLMDKLAEEKNQVFEASITNKTRELFK